MAWSRSKQETLALPVDALALLILRDYDQVRGWNWHTWMSESEHNGTARDQETKDALAEGWAWIIAHGLVMRDTTQSSAEAVKLTRLGRETLRYGVARLAAAERLGVALHPRLAQRIEQQFLLGEYELAVFAAMKEVEVRVRELAGPLPNESLVGVALMRYAFGPDKPGPLADVQTEGGEQTAAMNLFAGAIGLFKNPASHRPVDYDDPIVAGEIVLFADLLLRLLDQTAARLLS